jgi:hypothetical protein
VTQFGLKHNEVINNDEHQRAPFSLYYHAKATFTAERHTKINVVCRKLSRSPLFHPHHHHHQFSESFSVFPLLPFTFPNIYMERYAGLVDKNGAKFMRKIDSIVNGTYSI